MLYKLLAWLRQALPPSGDGNRLIYRLRHWPQLPIATMTADVYRTLSVMSTRPVNRHWILHSSRLKPVQVDSLLQALLDQGAVDIIDSARFVAPTTQTP